MDQITVFTALEFSQTKSKTQQGLTSTEVITFSKSNDTEVKMHFIPLINFKSVYETLIASVTNASQLAVTNGSQSDSLHTEKEKGSKSLLLLCACLIYWSKTI